MNPTISMRGQLTALILCACVVSLTELWWFGLALLGSLAAWWGVLNAGYARTLGTRPRRIDRVSKDLEVAVQMAVATTLPAVVAIAATATALRITTSIQLTIAAACALVFFWAMYASALVDWYYIRPRRDGVVREPPCLTSRQPRWTPVTRWWYRHRTVTPCVCFLAASLAVGFFALALTNHSGNPSGVTVGGAFFTGAAFAATVIRWFYGSLHEVGFVFTSCVLNAPDHALGDRLVLPVGEFFLRDVAVEGVVLVPINRREQPSGDREVQVAVSNINGATDVRRRKFTGCQLNCSGVNFECQWIAANVRRPCRPRTLVILHDIDEASGQRVPGYPDRIPHD